MKKSIKITCWTAGILVIAAIATYSYRHRYDKYELTEEEQQTVMLEAKKHGKTIGNTEHVAGLFAKELGADLFRIETERTYPLTRGALIESTKEEQDKNEHPALKTHVEDMDQYEIIFLGYPLWWYDFPMPIYSFFDEYNLEGKTIVLFTTHEDDVADAESNIKRWLKNNGFEKQ